jgi:putrescine transport system ATP-binding protein
MDRGLIVQTGTPAEIYEQPNSRFVADFIGLANMFEGEIIGRTDGRLKMRCDPLGGEISAPDSNTLAAGAVALVIRPEKLTLNKAEAADGGLPGTVRHVVYLGDESIFHVTLQTGVEVQVTRMNADRHAAGAIRRGDAVRVGWAGDAVVVMPR